ncbi:MAG: hypothetical protein ACTSO9_07565 [Candidatus Helarchaeota archaeon]
MEKTSEMFRVLAYNIINLSRLEVSGGKMIDIFRRYLGSRPPETLAAFQDRVDELYSKWQSRGGSIEGISGFFSQYGREIFLLWLSEIYPFQKENLIIDCPEGHSAVDSQIIVSYVYDKAELDYIRFVLNKLDIREWRDRVNEVARILFVDAIKSISDYFEELIGTKYKIYTGNINLYDIDVNGSVFVEFKGMGRIQ